MQNKNSMFWKTSWPTWRAGQPDPTKLTWVRIDLFFSWAQKTLLILIRLINLGPILSSLMHHDSNLQSDLKTMTLLPFLTIWTILILKTLNYTHVVIPKIKTNYMMHHQKYYAHVRCNRSLPVKCWVRSCFRQIDTELRILNQVYEYVSGVAKSKIFFVIENENKKIVSNRFFKSWIIFCL